MGDLDGRSRYLYDAEAAVRDGDEAVSAMREAGRFLKAAAGIRSPDECRLLILAGRMAEERLRRAADQADRSARDPAGRDRTAKLSAAHRQTALALERRQVLRVLEALEQLETASRAGDRIGREGELEKLRAALAAAAGSGADS